MASRAERKLEQAIRDLATALRTTQAPWMIIGGIAVIGRGVRRFTTDVDAAVRGDAIDISALLAAFAKRRIVPRIPRAPEFARDNLVLLLRHETSGVDVDVSLAWTAFEHEAIAAATITAFGSVKAPMARPEDLIVFKSIAGRGKDIEDTTALLTLYPKIDLPRIRAHVRELAALADAPELVDGLETAVNAAKAVRRSATPTKKPRSRRRPSARSGRSSSS